LSAKQRAHLKSLAHPLKPVHQVGKEGVTERTVAAVLEAFNTREILKVKVLDTAPMDVRGAGEMLASSIEDAHLVQVIGRTLVLYRPDPDSPESLP
jgi:RNA-binding protein